MADEMSFEARYALGEVTADEMFEVSLLRLDLSEEQRQMLRDVLATFYRVNQSVGISPPPALPPLRLLDPERNDGDDRAGS